MSTPNIQILTFDIHDLAETVHQAIHVGPSLPGYPALLACWDTLTKVTGDDPELISGYDPGKALQTIHDQVVAVIDGSAIVTLKEH